MKSILNQCLLTWKPGSADTLNAGQ